MDVRHEWTEVGDPVTGRRLWRLTGDTADGDWNMTPVYHARSAFTNDGRLLFGTAKRGGALHLLRFDLERRVTESLADWPATPENEDAFRLTVLPDAGKALVHCGRRVLLVDGGTGAQAVACDDLGDDRVRAVCAAPDGSALYFTRTPSLARRGVTERLGLGSLFAAYVEHYGGMPTDFVRLDPATGREEVIHHEPTAGCDHILPCPADGALLLLDLNFPPGFSWYGDHGETPRAWLLDTRTRQTRAIRPRNANRFQMHSNWSFDGALVFYHGRDRETGAPVGKEGGGHYLGVARASDGAVVWERVFPDFHYGHVCPHARRPTMLLNGGLTGDLLLECDFRDAGPDGAPRLDILCRHHSHVRIGSFPTYPFPHMAPDGRHVAFHACDGARSDVFLLEV
jgi:hypothetical protein